MDRRLHPAVTGRVLFRGSLFMCILLGGLTVAGGGCTRPFYRKQADKEVNEVLAEKDRYPNWAIEQYHVYPDPRARFADPTDPDHPPMPPDDPAAWDMSPHPQKPGKAGTAMVGGTGYLDLLALWDEQNRTEALSGTTEAPSKSADETSNKPTIPAQEKPNPERNQAGYGSAKTAALATSLSSKPGGPRPYLLKPEQAVELGLINSREYQDRREDLYMTALPVSLERFSFAAQFFAVEQAMREWAGRETGVVPRNNWTLNSNAGFSKLFSTGALLLFNFANQTVFNLAGQGRSLTSQSTINFDLIQPLLRGGGRAVTLEPLTQAERNLLYEIRTFARFQKEFYVAIAGGGAGGGGSITGATFQPVGVIAPITFSPSAGLGSSGLTPGVIPFGPVAGNPGLQVSPGGAGAIGLQTALAAPIGGYLNTLLQAAQRQVDLYNIAKLEEYLALAKATEEGGDISKLQVDQFEQQLLTRRTTLLTDQLQYLQSLDQFKLQLGLPTELPIELDDTPFRPLNEQFRRYEDLFNQFVAASDEPLRFGTLQFVTSVRKELRRIFTSAPVVRGTRFSKEIGSTWSSWEKLSEQELRKRLAELYEERRQVRGKQADLETRGQSLSVADQQRLDRLNAEIDLGEFESVLREYESQPWNKLLDPELQRRQQQGKFRYVVNAFILVLAEARNERIVQLRGAWPDLARLCVNGVNLLKADLDDSEAAVIQAALTNRLDLMNVRAQTVDAWRQVAIFANALLAAFNVQYHMSTSTPAGLAQPLNFSGSRTQHELILNAQLPLVRKREQIDYRACLINYQRARRILQRAEDGVAYDTRNEIRLLRQQEELYRIQQRLVELGYLTVENSLDTFRAPPAPGTAASAANAAALTTQLINAQNSLYQAQFQMTTIWITYLNTRLQLYRDMELMPLDARGVWTDELTASDCGDNGPCAPNGQIPADAKNQRPERLPEPQPVPNGAGPAHGNGS